MFSNLHKKLSIRQYQIAVINRDVLNEVFIEEKVAIPITLV